jgi:hypothetical protein
MELLIKYATRSRPELFKRTLQRYYDGLSTSSDYRFIISIDEDDDTMMDNQMLQWLATMPNLTVHIGASKTKIQAINADIPVTGWDVLLVASDDMIPVTKGYDEIIRAEMKTHCPDLDGALWFPDGLREEKKWPPLCTLPVMGAKLYERMGYVYHPAYESVFCDDEYHLVLSAEGRLHRCLKTIIKHEWIDATGRDGLFERNSQPAVYQRDNITFTRRKAEGFPK